MTQSKTILITGFEPFGDAASNPSGEVARVLDDEQINGRTVVGRVLPVEFGRAKQQLRALIDEIRPELVLCLGVAASRPAISLERVAVNLDDASIPDNAGQQPIDQPVEESAPTAYLTTLPVKAMFAGMQAAGYPTELSSSAGNYVCNHLFFALMHSLDSRENVRGGFVHVPSLSTNLTQERLTAAIALGAEIALATAVDVAISGGRID
ncbi:MAG: pyroglutamyl-peptidase I [Opitutaceae bacterium]|nr:pyroglutamyl-peptidase I [Opitutaceae bacterium]